MNGTNPATGRFWKFDQEWTTVILTANENESMLDRADMPPQASTGHPKSCCNIFKAKYFKTKEVYISTETGDELFDKKDSQIHRR